MKSMNTIGLWHIEAANFEMAKQFSKDIWTAMRMPSPRDAKLSPLDMFGVQFQIPFMANLFQILSIGSSIEAGHKSDLDLKSRHRHV